MAAPISRSRASCLFCNFAQASRPTTIPSRSYSVASKSFRAARHGTPPTRRSAPAMTTTNPIARRALHTSTTSRSRRLAHNNEEIPDEAPTTDFSRMDMLGGTPVPSTSVDICMSEGFQLNNGIKVLDGSGVLLVNGEAFSWRPWGADKKLVNARGQWEVPGEALALLGLLWPRPDLLVLGLGPEIRPISPQMRKHISSLGLRVEVLDTRNAASQFNMLATERGVDVVAAALIPIGWREGVGAV